MSDNDTKKPTGDSQTPPKGAPSETREAPGSTPKHPPAGAKLDTPPAAHSAPSARLDPTTSVFSRVSAKAASMKAERAAAQAAAGPTPQALLKRR